MLSTVRRIHSAPPGAARWIAVLTLAALSLAPSWAHLLEALPRLARWPPALWREATVFNGQYLLFEWIGGPVDVIAILAIGWLAWSLRAQRLARRPAVAAALLYLLALGLWLAVVAPANAVLATWVPGPLPADFAAVRDRWEAGHMAIAAIKLLGFGSLALAAARR
jgi:hypothetical protein